MEKIILNVKTREEKRKAAAKLRAQGQTPAVVYGHGEATEAITADSKELTKIFADAGYNKIIGLKIDGSRLKNVLIHEVQEDPQRGQLIHADFYLVKMNEKLETEVPLHFVGESTAVYQQEGTLIKNLEVLEIRALPGDLPESIEVDISILDDFEKSIHVSDLVAPAGVEFLTDTEELVAKVEAPRSDEELAKLDEEIKEELPEGVADEAAPEADAKDKDKS